MKYLIKILILFCIIPFGAQSQIVYVNSIATGNNNGTTWADAYTDLQDALNAAEYNDTIWVAGGSYFPDQETGDRTLFFQLKNGVALFGGFSGIETSIDQRDWEDYPCILSGDIGIPGNITDNTHTLIYTEYCDTSTILDGFIIERAWADTSLNDIITTVLGVGSAMYIKGAGLNNEASPTINNCIFRNNFTVYGGTIFYDGRDSGAVTIRIRQVDFQDNSAGASSSGAALLKLGGGIPFMKSYVSNCNFSEGFCGNGGAIYYGKSDYQNGDLLVDSSSFNHNSAFFNGGAIVYRDVISDSTSLEIRNCTFLFNDTWMTGGAIYLRTMNNQYTIDRCTFQYNNSGYGQSDDTGITRGGAISLTYEGGLFEFPESVMSIENCTFKNNISDHGGAIAFRDVKANITNCLFSKNRVKIGGGAISSHSDEYLTTETTFINCTFSRNTSVQKGGAFFRDDFLAVVGDNKLNIVNSIIWANLAVESGNKILLGQTDLFIKHSIIDVVNCDSIAASTFTSGNAYSIFCDSSTLFNLDPLFQDTANNNYKLSVCSPAINIGDNLSIDTLGIFEDLEQRDRIINGVVDLGAFENDQEAADLFINNSIINASGENVYDGFITTDNISGGFPPYSYLWNTGDTTQSISGLLYGDYSLTITDAVYCTYEYFFFVDFTNGIKNAESISDFNIFPNPSSGIITLDLTSFPKAENLLVFNTLGQAVYTQKAQSGTVQIIDLRFLESGIYHLVLLDEAGQPLTQSRVVLFD
jgi:hypothetical protein